ncbi:MAG: radical SAM protein [Methanomicrobiaceae archaeon]|nr:radical SAM protein [Methanomicrobiaceae archaeon]
MQISEIFRSIQGEGKRQGYPSIFVRCAGCNLACRWCDTPLSREGGQEMPEETVLHEIRRYPGRRLCITGGEPLLQADALLRLLRQASAEGYSVEIETNGTIDFRPFQSLAAICMDVKCPSSGEQSNLSLIPYLHLQDSLKFVVADEQDCRYASAVLDSYPPSCEVFLSPVWGSNYGDIAGFILEEGLSVRLQVQLHKVIGVR